MADGQPKLALFGHSDTPFTEKCRRALVFKGLDFDFHVATGPEDVRRWSPETGLLPVLQCGEERVADSTRILLWLEERFPEPPLLSPDPMTADQQKRLEDWADESFLWYFQEWLRLERTPSAPPATLGARLRRLVGARADAARRRARAEISQGLADRLDDLVNLLGGRPFFYADHVSLADLTVHAMLFVLRRDRIPGVAELLEQRPPLTRFMRRVEEETGG